MVGRYVVLLAYVLAKKLGKSYRIFANVNRKPFGPAIDAVGEFRVSHFWVDIIIFSLAKSIDCIAFTRFNYKTH